MASIRHHLLHTLALISSFRRSSVDNPVNVTTCPIPLTSSYRHSSRSRPCWCGSPARAARLTTPGWWRSTCCRTTGLADRIPSTCAGGRGALGTWPGGPGRRGTRRLAASGGWWGVCVLHLSTHSRFALLAYHVLIATVTDLVGQARAQGNAASVRLVAECRETGADLVALGATAGARAN